LSHAESDHCLTRENERNFLSACQPLYRPTVFKPRFFYSFFFFPQLPLGGAQLPLYSSVLTVLDLDEMDVTLGNAR